MSFTIYNYEYHLEGYTENPFSLKEYKTSQVNVNENDTCPIVTVESYNNRNIDYNNITTSSISSSISSLSSLSLSTNSSDNSDDSKQKNINNDIKNYKVIRSCDHFNSKMIETDDNIDLEINDKDNELKFNLKYEDINISSYDLIKLINKFGSKKLQKNYEHKKIFEYFKNDDILKLYNKDSALSIIKKVQFIFRNRLQEIKKNCIFNLDFLEAINQTDKKWKKSNGDIIYENLKENTLYNYIDTFMISLSILQRENDYTHIKWINPNQKEKIVVFGDFHGSLSTFVRHLLRFKKIGILDENCKIKENYSIMFLGDIVDRGIYSYEILMILYLLIINNPEKIILVCGNHEELNTNGRLNRYLYIAENITSSKSFVGNFINELLGKFKKPNEMLEIYTEIINVMRLQPSALIVQDPQNEDKYIYMAHGCLPHDKNNIGTLDEYFKNKIKEKKSFCISNEIAIAIRWNDFHGKKETENSVRTTGNTADIVTIGKNILDEALDYGIVTVIRGHEDLFYNTKIIEDNSQEWMSINKVVIEENKDYSKKLLCKNFNDILGNMTHAIQLNNKNNRFLINDKKTNYLPILTISTNTDIGKNLTSDSYIIISFSNHVLPKCSQQGGLCFKHKFLKYAQKIT